MTLSASLFVSFALVLGRNHIGMIFSTDPVVLELFPSSFVALAVFIVFDSI